MVDEARKKAVHERYLKTVTPLHSKAIRTTAEAMKELDDGADEIQAALKDGSDPELLATYQRDLKLDMEGAMNAAIDVRAALEAIDEVAKDDDDFEADQDEIKKGKAGLLNIMEMLKTALRDGDTRRQDLAKAIAAAKKDAVRASTSWVGLMTFAEKRGHDLERALKEWQSWRADAEAAAKAGKAAELKALQDKPPGGAYEDVVQGDYSDHLTAKFAKDFPPAYLPKSVTDRVKKDMHVLKESDKQLLASGKKCADVAATVAKLTVKARDAKKAAALLKLPASLAAKLQPILALDDAKAARQLGELAKLNRIDLDGTEAMAKLKKAGI